MLSRKRSIASNNKKQKEKKADEQKPSILFLYHCSRDTITVLPRQPIEILNLRKHKRNTTDWQSNGNSLARSARAWSWLSDKDTPAETKSIRQFGTVSRHNHMQFCGAQKSIPRPHKAANLHGISNIQLQQEYGKRPHTLCCNVGRNPIFQSVCGESPQGSYSREYSTKDSKKKLQVRNTRIATKAKVQSKLDRNGVCLLH